MFQFGRFPSLTYVFSQGFMVLHHEGFPIRKSAGQSLFPANRSLSQVIASFVGSQCQGIHLMLFFAWTASLAYSLEYFKFCFLAWVIANNCLGCKSEKTFQIHFFYFRLGFSPKRQNCFLPLFYSEKPNLKIKVFLNIQLSVSFAIRFSMNVVNLTSYAKLDLVGSSGLEPPTSRLSGGCSNQLSYKPIFCV